MNDKIYRAWINQPSTLQPLHEYHGKRCIVNDTDDKTVTIYFTEGAIHSMMVPRLCISRIYISAAEQKTIDIID